MPELLANECDEGAACDTPSNTLPRSKRRSFAVASSAPNRSFVRACQKARRVRFFRNGDQFFKGVWYAVTSDRFRSFEALLEDLTRTVGDLVNLPHGVRHVFSVDGRQKVHTLDELGDGASYVCSSSELFKRVDYLNARPPRWSYSATDRGRCRLEAAALSLDFSPGVAEPNDFVHPRIVTVIRNGVKPRRVVRLLLNKRTASCLAQVLGDITAAVKLDSGAVRKVFSLDGKLVNCLADFFQDDDVFIAYGSERMSIDDFYLDTEECKFLYSSRFRSVRPSVPFGAKSPNFGRRAFRSGVGGPSPMVRRRFLHHRNQAALRGVGRSKASPNSCNGVDVCSTPQSQHAPAQPADGAGDWSERTHPLEIQDRYKIGRVIGDGNFAVVLDSYCRQTRAAVALKVIDKSKCVGKEELVENEVALLQRLRHGNIVRLHHFLDIGDRFYLSLELVPGGDLFDALVRSRQYSEGDAARLMHNVCSALEYLHSLNIVHRDVKPENLLLFEDEKGRKQLKLADFGLATEANRVLYTVCGTPTYVAPEILAETGYGMSVDNWAAGVILYIMLVGFPPFISMRNSQEELFEQILSGHFTFPEQYWDQVSCAAKGLIQSLLQRQPEERFSAEDVLIHPWITGEARVSDEYEELARASVQAAMQHHAYAKPSHSFYDEDNVEFYYSRRRSMDDLSTASRTDLTFDDDDDDLPGSCIRQQASSRQP